MTSSRLLGTLLHSTVRHIILGLSRPPYSFALTRRTPSPPHMCTCTHVRLLAARKRSFDNVRLYVAASHYSTETVTFVYCTPLSSPGAVAPPVSPCAGVVVPVAAPERLLAYIDAWPACVCARRCLLRSASASFSDSICATIASISVGSRLCECQLILGDETATHPDHTVALHHRDLNVLRSGLHNLEQRLDRQLDRLVALEVIRVVLLQELPDRLGRTADGASLWCQLQLSSRSR